MTLYICSFIMLCNVWHYYLVGLCNHPVICTAHTQLRMIILCLLLLSNGGTLSYPVASHPALAFDHTTMTFEFPLKRRSRLESLVYFMTSKWRKQLRHGDLFQQFQPG